VSTLEGLGTGPSSALDSTYGALLVGLLFATFLQGFLTVQAYNYYEDYPKDPLRNKIIVGLVWCLDAIHLVLTAQSAYHYLITNWGYQPALVRSSREICVQLIFIAVPSFVCQIFFLNRIWMFSHRNIFIVGSILAICVVTLGLYIVITVQILQVPSVTEFGARRGEIIAAFTLGAGADILIAGLLWYYLQHDLTGFETTKSLVGRILRYTMATGLVTSALAVASVVAYLIRPQGFYFIAIHFCLGRMYTNALLVTLNARHKMRRTFEAHQGSGSAGRREAGVRSIESTRFIPPFQGIGHTTSSSDHGLTYTVERTTNHGDGDFRDGKVHGKAPFSVV